MAAIGGISLETGRTDELLSAFLTDIVKDEPVDNYFQITPTLDILNKAKKMIAFGKQGMFPIDSGENNTVQWMPDGYTPLSTAAQDTALTVTYPAVQMGGTLVVSLRDLRDNANDRVRVFDLMRHRRKNLIKTAAKKLSTDLFAASQASHEVTSLNVAIDSTGATGGLNASTDADWASIETASGGAFSSNGMSDMNDTWNQIVQNGARPKDIITTRAMYTQYSLNADKDIRYTSAGGTSKGARGFGDLMFNTADIKHDPYATSGVMYFIDTDYLYLIVDPEVKGDMTPMRESEEKLAFISKFAWAGNLFLLKRDGQGKITGMT